MRLMMFSRQATAEECAHMFLVERLGRHQKRTEASKKDITSGSSSITDTTLLISQLLLLHLMLVNA